MNFVVKVRTCRNTCIADCTNNLSLRNEFSLFNADSLHMAIAGINTVLVFDNYIVTEAEVKT